MLSLSLSHDGSHTARTLEYCIQRCCKSSLTQLAQGCNIYLRIVENCYKDGRMCPEVGK